MRTLLGTSLLMAALAVPAAGLAQDSDGDGASDATDSFPCDPSLSGVSYYPSQGQHSQIVFEDQFPADGDLDFNDVVVGTNMAFTTDSSGNVLSIRATFNLLAQGGIFHSGWGFHLPVARGSVASVTRTVGAGSPQPLTLEVDSEATVLLSQDARELFSVQDTTLFAQINSDPTIAVKTAQVMQVDIVFAAPVALNMGLAPFDFFIFRMGRPELQVHLPAYPGTAAMDTGLFGTQDDTSSPGRWFTGSNGLPFALNLFGSSMYPQEGVSISTLYPNIVNFAQSGGTADTDFMSSQVVSGVGFAGAPTPSFIGADTFAVDMSCVPAPTCTDGYQNQGEAGVDCGGPCASCVTIASSCPPASVALPLSCEELRQAGAGTGTYCVDPDGPNGQAGLVVYCDQDTLGGGWTAVANVTTIGPTYQTFATKGGTDYLAPLSVSNAIRAAATEVRFECRAVNGAVIDQISSNAAWLARPVQTGYGCANGYRYAASASLLSTLTPGPANTASIGTAAYGGGCCCRPNVAVGYMTAGFGQSTWFMYDPYYRRAYPTCAGTTASYMRIYYR